MRKLQRFLVLILCLCLFTGNAFVLLVHAEADAICINNLEDFLIFAENCRLDSYSQGRTFRLTADIDLSDTGFDGIPIFCGTFEGEGHTIRGLNIVSPGTSKGLFRYATSSAVIRDLNVNGTVTPSGTRSQVGGIAGRNGGLIENCSFQGTVSGSDYIGGIAGINQASGMIRNCIAEGNIAGKHFIGGIAGSNDGSIADSVNKACINTSSQHNNITLPDITLDNLLNSESAATTTDIGGIAGISGGIVLNCTNYGSVGYPYMGYNVGGIAGLQAGYVASCKNYGTVSGRKEVGGIVGQQEPEVVLHYSTDTLQILQAQISVLSDLVDCAVLNGNANATHIKNLLYKVERYSLDAQEAADYLKESAENPKFEDLQAYADAMNTIQSSISEISSTLRSLWDAMDDTMNDFERDMLAISNQLAEIESTLNQAETNLGGQILDISDQDTPEQLGSKLETCFNYGAVDGDLNVGGILGAVSIENDLDAEEDITIAGNVSLNAIGSLRSIVIGCQNTGTVTAKYQRAGGIAGYLSMGSIKDAINLGAVGTDTADYVGGIAGASHGFIRNCKVKSRVRGEAYVGGIAGSGTIVSDCYAMVSLVGSEGMGGILGKAVTPYHETGMPIANNFYHTPGTDFGGVDGISYEGITKGLTLEIFQILQKDCDIFRYVTVTFLADAGIVHQITLPVGTALTEVPTVPKMTGSVGYWDGLSDTNIANLVFDVTFQALYAPYTHTIQSQETNQNGRPILLLQGDFFPDAIMRLQAMQSIDGYSKEARLLQGWAFSVENCVALQSGRILIPQDADPDHLVLLIRNSAGNWEKQTYQRQGSYLVFSLSIDDTAVALLQDQGTNMPSLPLVIAITAGLIAIFAIFLAISLKQKKKHKTDATQVSA